MKTSIGNETEDATEEGRIRVAAVVLKHSTKSNGACIGGSEKLNC